MDAIEGGPMTAFMQVGAVEAETSAGAKRDEMVKHDQLVHVRLTLNSSVGAVWQILVSPAGTAAWLGEGAVLGEKGQSFHCTDGSGGLIRSFHPLEQLRLSWTRDPELEPTLVELDVTPVSGGTMLRLWHEGVPEDERRSMRIQWQNRLTLLAALGGWTTFVEI
jgi:uncharacterized protein YndB with AHSA1/START domain